ncbi:OmpH family outer membrane protein [Desulfobaculum bizertense]|uniref:OmpH family outer membrane protein n=1 Tax=Desulfobaculum bizertense TaxID=376490 RepID=UPI001F43D86D|nr:OmpH family outer membrane protein [Desulfobaculum bizertense]UIJ38043.1 OmpH family outer membrane protein [Desulfobaculum bizertense]
MRIKLMVVAVLMLALAGLTGCQQEQKASPKLAVVDANEVYQNCDFCVEAGEYLKGLSMEFQQKVATLQAQTTGKEKPDAAAMKAMRDEAMKLQQKMTGEQQRLVTILDKELKSALDAYRAEKGLSVIMNRQQAVSFDESSDVTKDIIAAMNARKIDLGIPAPEKKESAAPEKAAEESK